MSRGFTTRMRNDGLIVVKPRRQKRIMDFPLRGVFLLLLGSVFFKGFILASVGPDTYSERVAILNSGTFVEQGCAWVMQVGPISQIIANYMGPILWYQ